MIIKSSVFQNMGALNEKKRIFERICEVPDSIKVPFDTLVSDFKFLFGQDVIVEFQIQ